MAQDSFTKLQNSKRAGMVALLAFVCMFMVIAMALTGCSNSATTPQGAAAKYGGSSYIYEDDVTNYIQSYRGSIGYLDVSDEAWATYLKSNSLTPSTLRRYAIEQLAQDELVMKKCQELGITVDDSDVQKYIDYMKGAYGFNDEDTWQQTLAMYNTTEDELRESYRLELYREKLYDSQVERTTPTDDEVLSYAQLYASSLSSDERTTKHTYCFKISGDEGGSLTNSTIANRVHETLAADGALTVENFATAVTMYSDDDDLKASTGANGWDLDNDDYGTAYTNQLEGLSVGQMSEVFMDDDGKWTIIYVDTSYTFPATTSEISAMTLDSMPNSLREYMKDSCAYVQWYNACEDYIPGLLDAAGIEIYTMPEGLPYNVDMSLASNTSNTSNTSNASSTNAANSANTNNSTSN